LKSDDYDWGSEWDVVEAVDCGLVYEKLVMVHAQQPDLFVEGWTWEDYGPLRSGCRGANTRAFKMLKGRKDQVDWFFRWNTGGDETSSVPMHVLYAEKRELVNLFLHVSEVL
jgi:hypothetical protein